MQKTTFLLDIPILYVQKYSTNAMLKSQARMSGSLGSKYSKRELDTELSRHRQ